VQVIIIQIIMLLKRESRESISCHIVLSFHMVDCGSQSLNEESLSRDSGIVDLLVSHPVLVISVDFNWAAQDHSPELL